MGNTKYGKWKYLVRREENWREFGDQPPPEAILTWFRGGREQLVRKGVLAGRSPGSIREGRIQISGAHEGFPFRRKKRSSQEEEQLRKKKQLSTFFVSVQP